MKKIEGINEAYIKALDSGAFIVDSKMFISMVDRLSELENAVIELKAGLRTCSATSTNIMERYKDL